MISDYIEEGTGFRERDNRGMAPAYDIWGTVLAPSENTAKGSVRVRVRAMKDKTDTFDNVPVLAAYGGSEYGCFFIPEEGDIVLLTFPCGDFRHPIVTGCRFPVKNRFTDDMYHKDNLRKGWKMKNGSSMTFAGEKGKEKITLAGSEKMDWELDEEGERISFGDRERKNSMSVEKKSGRAVLSAEEEILLKCGKCSVSLKKDGTMSLCCENLTVEAKSVKIKGKSRLQLEGQDLKLEASTGLALSSRGQMKLESKGQLKLKGAMINLN